MEQFCNLQGCLSLAEAQQRLEAGGLRATPRQMTRLLALTQAGLWFSWSALEGLLAEAASLLMDAGWTQLAAERERLSEACLQYGMSLREHSGRLEILSQDELWMESQELALVPQLESQRGALAMRSGEGLAGLSQWPDSWKIVADAEDSARILEHLRSAFRSLRQQGQSPGPLLWLALKRRRPEVTREVARLTYEYLDADAGRQLEALFSHQAVAALKQLRQRAAQGWDLTFLVGLLQILWDQPELQADICDLLEALADSWLLRPELILGWWEEVLSQVDRLDTGVVQRVAQLNLEWQARGLPLRALWIRRLQRGLSLSEKLLTGWLLCQSDLSEQEWPDIQQAAIELSCQPHLTGQSLVRVCQMLQQLGPSAWMTMLSPEVFAQLQEDVRCWLVKVSIPLPELASLANQRALDELLQGSRLMLRQLGTLEWQPPENLEDDLYWRLVGFLEAEIAHLEEPDDSWVIALLVRLDPEVLQRLYQLASRDAQLESRAFPARLHSLVKHAAATDRPLHEGVLGQLLEASPGYHKRPEIWKSWAHLFRAPGLSEEFRQRLCEQLKERALSHPDLWPYWLGEIQASPVASWRDWAEAQMLQLLQRTEVSRLALQNLLVVLEERLSHWSQPSQLAQALSRILLFLSAPPTPQQQLRQALSRQAEGDGILQPLAWDVEQRDIALNLLGQLSLLSGLEESLARALRIRCWQFLRDWLEGVRQGGDSYQHRSMPLWTPARRFLSVVQGGEEQLVDDLAELMLSLQTSCPERLRLLTHGDALGFLLDWGVRSCAGEMARQRQVLTLMQQLLLESDRDYRPVAIGYLLSVEAQAWHPAIASEWKRLRVRWEGWLYGD
jgi:hypothetical protein